MKIPLLSLIICFFFTSSKAFTIEPIDPKKPQNNEQWKKIEPKLYFSFVDANFSLSKHHYPKDAEISNSWKTDAWKNESIHTQLAFWSPLTVYNGQNVEMITSDLTNGKEVIKKENISFTPVAFVLSDDPSKLKSGCGISIILDSTLVADRILNEKRFTYQAFQTKVLWLSIKIPSNSSPGEYKGKVILQIGKGKSKKELTLPYTVQVSKRSLPPAKEWNFHLDLWQNPFSSARYYKVEPFSDQHFKLINTNMKRLANAGQKYITASIIYDPWNSQTYDKYDSMIKWIKKTDGSWKYDYSKFDKWVDYMHGIGINEYINCYSMIPWNLKFYYYDESSKKLEVLQAKPEEDSYKKHWLPFLEDFAQHLKDKGWFDKTTIAMDERPMKDMQAAIAIIKKADKDFKISLAGNYHEELSEDIIDYSIPLNSNMPNDILSSRKAKGYKTTIYTCCSEIFPNTFTSSGFYEPTWLMLNAVEKGFDGYLRWAYDCWNKDPLHDTRFGPWPAGDTYLVYPDNQTSVRFENLIDGVQQAEKINILRKELASNPEELYLIEEQLKNFSNKNIKRELIPKQVKTLKKTLNSL